MEEILDVMDEVRSTRAARIFALVVVALVAWSIVPLDWKISAATRLVAWSHGGCDDCRHKAEEKPCIDCDDEALGLTLEQE